MPADAPKPAKHIREMTAEHAPVGVQLVYHDETKVFEELRPAGVMGKNARMQHVGVAEHYVRAPTDGSTRVLRRVAVIGAHANLEPIRLRELVCQGVQLRELILGERLRGKQIQRSSRRILHDSVQHGRVVAQGFSRRRGRGDDDVPARQREFDGRGLMGVEPLDPTSRQERAQPRIESARKEPKTGLLGRQPSNGRHPPIRGVWPIRCASGQVIKRGLQCVVACGIGTFG